MPPVRIAVLHDSILIIEFRGKNFNGVTNYIRGVEKFQLLAAPRQVREVLPGLRQAQGAERGTAADLQELGGGIRQPEGAAHRGAGDGTLAGGQHAQDRDRQVGARRAVRLVEVEVPLTERATQFQHCQ